MEVLDFYFAWPWALLLLALIPLFWWRYRDRQAVHWRQALRFSQVAVLEHLQQNPPGWRRLMYPLFISTLLLLLVVGLARPTLVGRIPVHAANIQIVMDISLSMLAEDMRPDRLTAAKTSAISFVESLPRDARVGLEFFAGNNYVLSPPTQDHREIVRYLENTTREHLQPRTEIGSALRTALDVLMDSLPAQEAEAGQEEDGTEPGDSSGPDPPEQVIILLSDGDSQEGYPWPVAARQAAERNVTIHAIGVGAPGMTTITYQGQEYPVTFDENTLRQIAGMTGGAYFRAYTDTDFKGIYEQIREKTVRFEEQDIELGFACCGLALLALTLGLTCKRFS